MNDTTIRLESTTYRAEPVTRLRVHSDGKVKTSLNVLAKGHQTYDKGGPQAIISDCKLFNQLSERKHGKNFVYTEHVKHVKALTKILLLAPSVPVHVTQTVGAMLTALLAFKGKTLEVVRRELALLNQAYQHETKETQQRKRNKHITYNVNTWVTWGEVKFHVGKVTVKKTFADGIFFCSDTCRTLRQKLTGAVATKDGQANTIE